MRRLNRHVGKMSDNDQSVEKKVWEKGWKQLFESDRLTPPRDRKMTPDLVSGSSSSALLRATPRTTDFTF